MDCNQSSAVESTGKETGATPTVRASSISGRHPAGFIVAPRGDCGLELIRGNKNAFLLLYVIAQRARWREGFDAHDLKPGQAFLGDHGKYGMSEREYRTAKRYLEKHGFATFKATSRGTIATIVNNEVFDCNACEPDGQSDRRATGTRRAVDEHPTTNEEEKKGRTKQGKVYRLTARSTGGSKGGVIAGETEWMERLERFFEGTQEMECSGGKFRVDYRADPGTWEGVLCDAESKKKGRLEFTSGPGAYLNDLAKRFGAKRHVPAGGEQ